ncbi:MAG TPA: hypothetical protein VGH41_14985 [Paraburkholderia sp.]|jgi:Spy/CpxP family protein refolding chaperone
MNRARTLIATSCLALAAVSAAHAASRDDEEKACRGDALHFCSAEIPDTDKITACMKQHVNQLSPGCRAMFKQGRHSTDQPGEGNPPRSD